MDSLRASGSLSIYQFFDLFEETLDKAWNSPQVKNVAVHEAYPNKIKPEDGPPVIITWKYTKQPWLMKDGKREIKPRYRREASNSYHPDIIIDMYAQRFTCTVNFELWSYDQKLLNRRSEEFTEFMTAFIPFFKQQGIGEIIFLEESNIEPQMSWREDLYGRSHFYRVDIEKVIPVDVRAINQIITTINVKKDLNDSDENALAHKIILTNQ